MRILAEGTKTYPDDPARHFEFGRFADRAGDFWLAAGNFDFSSLKSLAGQRVAYLDLEEPNRFFATDAAFSRHEYDEYFERVFTLCPYTAEWLNRQQGIARRTPTFFPFNERYIPAAREKEFDVIYAGHIVAAPVARLVNVLTGFNYRLVSGSDDPRVTDHSATYTQKLELFARSRISVVQNLLFLRDRHVKAVQATPDYADNEAFADVVRAVAAGPADAGEVIAPQIKLRVFEAALCRSLILCRRDRWNVIERFFTPGEEFVYYEAGELGMTLRRILDDFRSYEPIVDRAFERARLGYTTKAFFERYLSGLSFGARIAA